MGEPQCSRGQTVMLPRADGDATMADGDWTMKPTRRRQECSHGKKVMLPRADGDATMTDGDATMECCKEVGATAVLPRADDYATTGGQRCYHGALQRDTAMLPWSNRDAPTSVRRCYHGRTTMLPWWTEM